MDFQNKRQFEEEWDGGEEQGLLRAETMAGEEDEVGIIETSAVGEEKYGRL